MREIKTLAITRLWGGGLHNQKTGENSKCEIVNLINYYKLGAITLMVKIMKLIHARVN